VKHTFKCGIVGESNDGLGDEFLRGMIYDSETAENEIKDALIKPWKDELVRTQRALMYLIVKAGGEVRVPDHVIIKGNPDVSSWEIYRDESTQETVLRVPNWL
jgi:hypothetical protein